MLMSGRDLGFICAFKLSSELQALSSLYLQLLTVFKQGRRRAQSTFFTFDIRFFRQNVYMACCTTKMIFILSIVPKYTYF